MCNIPFENELDQKIFADRLYRYIQNDEENAMKILSIVSKLKWVKSKEINDFLISYIKKHDSSSNLYVSFGNGPKSSSSHLLSIISSEGVCKDDQIVNIDDIKERGISEDSNIYFIDDYIGSGETILRAIDCIWDIIRNNNVYILSYASQEHAVLNINSRYPSVNIIYELELYDYKKIYKSDDINYIERVCRLCNEDVYRFGYNSAGACVILNKTAPNSDISMIWHNGIKYNGRPWFKLFDRELSLDVLVNRNKEMVKTNSIILLEEYNSLLHKYNITYREFEFLVYSYACYFTKYQLLEDKYFDTLEECDEFIDKLISKEYIKVKNGYILISNNSLYRDISKAINKIYRCSKKNNKKITQNF